MANRVGSYNNFWAREDWGRTARSLCRASPWTDNARGPVRSGGRTASAAPHDEDDFVKEAVAQTLGQITPKDRAGAVVERLLPLLAEPNKILQPSVAEALGRITPDSLAPVVMEKLFPLLGESLGRVKNAALEALGRIGPSGLSASINAIQLINSREDAATGWLRAAAHVATGADARNEGSEILLAWLGRPSTLPRDSVKDNPAAAHQFLQLLTNNWTALTKEPRARDEAENAAMAAIESACRQPSETDSLADFARASVAWLRDLSITGPVHRCWTSEQKRTVEALLADFKESRSTHEKALEADLKAEDLEPAGLWLTRSVILWTMFWVAFLIAFPWSRTVQAIFFWNPRARRFFSVGFVPLLLLVLPPLRRRLLAPFRDDLVAQARLDDLPRLGYFAGGRARVDGGTPIPISDLRSTSRGGRRSSGRFRTRQDELPARGRGEGEAARRLPACARLRRRRRRRYFPHHSRRAGGKLRAEPRPYACAYGDRRRPQRGRGRHARESRRLRPRHVQGRRDRCDPADRVATPAELSQGRTPAARPERSDGLHRVPGRSARTRASPATGRHI